ncbi:hypothetical protein HID58_084646 [Brassica napus]|uniref:Photosynthesis system II assembly factor Ycf48/Hcf136-like domain-containing protein n=1 Tax=Brassica napus TaxID=3708 RepID=A0ABQ7XKB5_BRANA|nr:hypothetical protein HID58_084646 [Brassica napus]
MMHTGRGTFVVHGGDEILFTEGANRSPGVMFDREMVSHEGAIYVASNKGYNWKAAVQETVSATLNSGASCYTGTFSAVNCAHALNHNSIDTMQSYWQPSNRAVARRIQNMGWRADGLLWLLVRGGEFILATALGCWLSLRGRSMGSRREWDSIENKKRRQVMEP